ncbi:peptidase M16 inactive domain protein [Mycoplasma sp. CAG:877]|nr:peptidase M16 inactive domain protein [Mycoplasma sp. CAG:877]
MEYIKKDLGSYKLHLIKTDKFKSITVKVSFHRVIKKNEITIRNILSDMFMQSSKKYNSKRELTIKAQDLYAAGLRTTNSRLGNYINTDFYLTVLNDKYTEDGNFASSLEFLSEIIFNPDVEDGKFNEEKLDIVKSTCRSALNSIKEDASNYSLIRMAEAFGEGEPISYRMMGYLDDLDDITGASLYEFYLDMIKNDFVDIFVIGDIDIKEVTDLIKKYFKFDILKKLKMPFMVDEKKPRRSKLVFNEKIDNTQSKLAIGCRINGLSEYERNYPLTLFNVIFGGCSDSKLFKEVREENSLCYTIYSITNKLDNVLLIRAGIDKENYKKTVSLIEKNLKDMCNGKFDENDILMAKEYYNTALEEIEDSQSKIINNYLMMELINTDDIDVKREKMSKVTKSEIVKVAKKVTIDTIFCLEGVRNEEDLF